MPSKRFYCTECQKVKRVSRMPASVENPYADTPEARIGTCRWHTSPQSEKVSHREFLGHKPRPSHNVKRKSSVVSTPPRPKPQRGKPRRSEESAA